MSQWKSLYPFLPPYLDDSLVYHIYLFLKPRDYLYFIDLLDSFYIYNEYSISSSQIKASIFYMFSLKDMNYWLELVFKRLEQSFEYQHLFVLNQSKCPLTHIEKKIALNFHHTYFSLSNTLSNWEANRWELFVKQLIDFLNLQYKSKHSNEPNTLTCMNCGHICFPKNQADKDIFCHRCLHSKSIKATSKCLIL